MFRTLTVNAKEGEEADALVDWLDTTTTRYKIEIGPDKTKMMTDDQNGFKSIMTKVTILVSPRGLTIQQYFDTPW